MFVILTYNFFKFYLHEGEGGEHVHGEFLLFPLEILSMLYNDYCMLSKVFARKMKNMLFQ